jgi:hypothetical protein
MWEPNVSYSGSPDVPASLISGRYQTADSYERSSVEHQIQACLSTRIPCIILQRGRCGVRNLTSAARYNKMFASEWYDGNTVLLVTKCNRLLQLDIPTGEFKQIETPKREPRPFSTRNIGTSSSMVLIVSSLVLGKISWHAGWGNSGKHCIGFNPSRTMFATGGTDPADLLIMDAVSMKPKVCLIGHKDWIFGTAWVTDSHVVSASRDCSVGLWNVKLEEKGMPSTDPNFPQSSVIRYQENEEGDGVVFNGDFSARIRDVKFCDTTEKLAVLSSDGGVRIMDPFAELAKVKSFYIPDSLEAVCMAQQPNKICIGCKRLAYLIDPRVRTLRHNVATFMSPDERSGVRSVEMRDNVLSYGTGRGSLVFHDLRLVDSGKTILQGDRSLCSILSSPFHGYYEGMERLQFGNRRLDEAIYSHKWDHSGTRLFYCGGPLMCGFDGHFCGIYT